MQQDKKNRLKKRIITGGIALLLIAAAAFYFLKPTPVTSTSKNGKAAATDKEPRIKQLLEDKIRDMVIEASDSLYQVRYTTFKIDMSGGKVRIKDLEIEPDSAVLRRLIAGKRAPNNVVRISVPSMTIDGFGFRRTKEGIRFAIDSTHLEHPTVSISNQLRPYNNEPTDPSALYKAFRGLYSRMLVGKTSIHDLDFKYINNNRGVTTHLKKLNILAKGFVSNPVNVGNKGRTNMNVGYFRLTTPDRLYDISAKNLSLKPEEKRLAIAHVSVLPRYSKAEFHKMVGFAKDRYHFELDQISWSGIDMDQFIRTQQLFVDNQTVGKSWIEIYTNYNYPLKKKQRRNAFPQEKFQTIALDLTFRKTNLLNGTILYRILAGETDKVSTLELTKSNTLITNLTNNTLAKRRNPETKVHSSMRVMDAGLMNSWYTFNLQNKAAPVTLYSVMGPMDANKFNILSRPLAKIEVKKGRINKLETYLKMNEYTATGHVNFYYSDMNIAFLTKDKDTLRRKGFLSFVSNAMLPNDNPRKNGKFRRGIVNVKREPWQSFFEIQFDASVDGMSSAMMGMYQRKKGSDKNILLNTAKEIAGSNRNK
jgi:hypothetical protein